MLEFNPRKVKEKKKEDIPKAVYCPCFDKKEYAVAIRKKVFPELNSTINEFTMRNAMRFLFYIFSAVCSFFSCKLI